MKTGKQQGIELILGIEDANGKRPYTYSVVKQKGRYLGIVRWRCNNKPQRVTKTLRDATCRADAQAIIERLAPELYLDATQTALSCFADHLDYYIDMLEASQSVRVSTIRAYRYCAEIVKRYIGTTKIRSITPRIAQNLLNEIAKSYAPTTVQRIRVLCSAACRELLQSRYILQNPFRWAKTPKVVKKQPNALNEKQRAKLKDYLMRTNTERLSIAALISLYSGMRRGEVCALTWQDIDFENNTITVASSMSRDYKGYTLKLPKTDRIRTIPLPDILKVQLKDWLATQITRGVPLTYVLADSGGKPYHPDALSGQWKVLSRLLELKGTAQKLATFHDLRHTFATAAVAANIDIKTVSHILGHASAAMTLDVYASTDEKALMRARIVINDVI